MLEPTATAEAGANIALTKYWGNADPDLRIPANDSISLTLDRTRTATTVSFQSDLDHDRVTVDGRRLAGRERERVVRHLDLLRALAKTPCRASVVSRNNFPAAAGVASSASGFAALTLAGAHALGLDLSDRAMSRLARQGSGSAARSIFGGFALLHGGVSDDDAFAEPLYDPDWWPLCDLVVILSASEKEIPSTAGHDLAESSPLYSQRTAYVPELNRRLLSALAARDLDALGVVAEQDALLMHAVMMTSCPPLFYWLPETVAIIHWVHRCRESGLPVYFTMDAGPNVHVLTLPEHAARLASELAAMPIVHAVLDCRPGGAAHIIDSVVDGRDDDG